MATPTSTTDTCPRVCRRRAGNLFLQAWIVGWKVAGAVILCNLLWRLLGRERILLCHDAVTLRPAIFGVGPPSRYELSRLPDL